MRVGVTVNFLYSFFSSGSPQTVLSVAEVLRIIGNDVVLINVDDRQRVWWDDVVSLKPRASARTRHGERPAECRNGCERQFKQERVHGTAML